MDRESRQNQDRRSGATRDGRVNRNALLLSLGLAISAPWLQARAAVAQDSEERPCEIAKSEALGRFAICKAKAGSAKAAGRSQTRETALGLCADRLAERWARIASEPDFAGTQCAASASDAQRRVLVELCPDRFAEAIDGGAALTESASCATVEGTADFARGIDLASRSAALTLYSGNATPGRVIKGARFSSSADSAGIDVAGAMANRGAITLAPGPFDVPIPKGFHNGQGRCTGDPDLAAGKIRRGVQMFSVTGAFTGSELLQTGQKSCYSASGAPIACAGTGQDGEQRKGWSRSFSDNGNGTITDNRTGLVWEKLSDDGGLQDKDNRYTFAAAMDAKITAMNAAGFGGHRDWRLPNRFELGTIVNLDRSMPATFDSFFSSCAPGCSAVSCSCTQNELYWTSSSYLNEAANAWLLYFGAGGAGGDSKTKAYHVRAVRGG